MHEARKYGPTHEEIEKRAYELYEERRADGATSDDGHALKDWLIAETELEQEFARRQPKRVKSRTASTH